MKTNKLKLGAFLIAGAFMAFTACKKENETTINTLPVVNAPTAAVTPTGNEVSTVKARTSLNTTSSNLASQTKGMGDSETTKGITALFKELGADSSVPTNRLASGIASISKKKKEFNEEPLKSVYGLTITLNETTHKPDTVVRSKTSNDVVIILPKGIDHPKVELTIQALKLVQVDGTDSLGNPIKEEMPTDLIANIKLDNTPTSAISLNAKYNSTGEPVFVNLDLSLDTYSINLDYLESGSNNKAEIVLKNGASVIIGGGLSVDYVAGSAKTDDDIEKITGYIQLDDVQLTGSIDNNAIKTYEKNVAEDLRNISEYNKHINLSIIEVSTGDQLAKVVLKQRPITNVGYVALVFKDGSEEDAEVVFKSVIDEIEAEIKDLSSSIQ